jgi:hypothetical protein
MLDFSATPGLQVPEYFFLKRFPPPSEAYFRPPEFAAVGAEPMLTDIAIADRLDALAEMAASHSIFHYNDLVQIEQLEDLELYFWRGLLELNGHCLRIFARINKRANLVLYNINQGILESSVRGSKGNVPFGEPLLNFPFLIICHINI